MLLEELREVIADGRASRLIQFYSEVTCLLAALPGAAELRKLSSYVDEHELRKIDDPEVIRKMFAELRGRLLLLAVAREEFDQKTSKPDL